MHKNNFFSRLQYILYIGNVSLSRTITTFFVGFRIGLATDNTSIYIQLRSVIFVFRAFLSCLFLSVFLYRNIISCACFNSTMYLLVHRFSALVTIDLSALDSFHLLFEVGKIMASWNTLHIPLSHYLTFGIYIYRLINIILILVLL